MSSVTINKRGGCLQGCATLAVAGVVFLVLIYIFKLVWDWLQSMYAIPV
jgi:hypothetical protein